MTDALLTSEEFARRLAEDEWAWQWTELVAGQPVRLEPPDLAHGAVVLNVAKAFAAYFQKSTDEAGYACFELGLVIARNPDTVRRPPVSIFVRGERFAELERPVTETRPLLVIEIASTNDRRRAMRERVESYFNAGIRTVWTADTVESALYVLQPGKSPQIFRGDQRVSGAPLSAPFEVPAREIFRMPQD